MICDLTNREREVLAYLASGQTVREISCEADLRAGLIDTDGVVQVDLLPRRQAS